MQRRVIVQRRLAASALVVALGAGVIALLTSAHHSRAGSHVSAQPAPSDARADDDFDRSAQHDHQ